MSKETPLQLDTDIANQLPTNGQQLITATKLRGVLGSIVDSFSQQNVVPVVTSPYTVLNANYQNLHVINRSSPTTINLPVPGGVPNEFTAGWSSFFSNIGSGMVTLVPAGGKTINGLSSITLPTGYSANISSDGTNYFAAVSNTTSGLAAITFIIDGGGIAIAAGIKGDLEIPFDCVLLRSTLLADQVGSIVVDVWKDTFAAYPPTVVDSITGGNPPTITAANKSQDTVLTGWTLPIAAGSIIRINVNSAATITRCTLSLVVLK